jgi:hypothetical protein
MLVTCSVGHVCVVYARGTPGVPQPALSGQPTPVKRTTPPYPGKVNYSGVPRGTPSKVHPSGPFLHSVQIPYTCGQLGLPEHYVWGQWLFAIEQRSPTYQDSLLLNAMVHSCK